MEELHSKAIRSQRRQCIPELSKGARTLLDRLQRSCEITARSEFVRIQLEAQARQHPALHRIERSAPLELVELLTSLYQPKQQPER